MLRVQKAYLLLTILLFIAELLIGIYVQDGFIRPYAGDFLVVILIYCFVKAFVAVNVNKAAAGVLLFSYIIEVLQYFKITVLLGLKNVKLANIIIGNSFSWGDIVAYTLGIAIVLAIEKFFSFRVEKSTCKVTH